MQKNKNIMTALVKSLNVIKSFDSRNREMTLSDVAKKVDITRASARRILLTLESLGYLNQRDNFFFLTPKVIELGYSYYASLPWTDLAYENLKKVAHQCKLSCSISILDSDFVICIMRISAVRVLGEGIHIGSKLPAAYTATGRVFMAHMDNAKLKKYIKKLPLYPHTSKSIIKADVLYDEIVSKKNLDYQIVEEELEDGLISIAVPIYNKSNNIIGTMNIGTHVGYKNLDFIKKEVLPLLKQAAKETTDTIIALQY